MKNIIFYGNIDVLRYFKLNKTHFLKKIAVIWNKLLNNPDVAYKVLANDNISYNGSIKNNLEYACINLGTKGLSSLDRSAVNSVDKSKKYASKASTKELRTSTDIIPRVEDVDLVELINQEIKLHKILNHNKQHLRIEFDCDFKKCKASFTKEHLRFVISNLISNSIKNSEDSLLVISIKPAIKYDVVCGNHLSKFEKVTQSEENRLKKIFNKVYVTIRDYGIDIPEQNYNQLFAESVYPRGILGLHAANANLPKKLGLGLASCFSLSTIKKIMNAHGMRIWARNNSDMDIYQGVAFEFAMPIKDYEFKGDL